MFPLLLGLECEEGYQQVSSLIENHVEELQKKIEHYFSLLSIQVYDWAREIFSENLTSREEEELCELQSDHTFKMKFTDLPLDRFWTSVKESILPFVGKQSIFFCSFQLLPCVSKLFYV
jgi:hypothetical protein